MGIGVKVSCLCFGSFTLQPAPPRGCITAIALWHAAKAASVREFADDD